MAEHASLDGQELTATEAARWRLAYATWRTAGCTPDQAIAHADTAVREDREREAGR